VICDMQSKDCHLYQLEGEWNDYVNSCMYGAIDDKEDPGLVELSYNSP
jgi:hypothetical protein